MWTAIKYCLAVVLVVVGFVLIVANSDPIFIVPLVLGVFIYEREDNNHAEHLAAQRRRRAEEAARPAPYWPPADRF